MPPPPRGASHSILRDRDELFYGGGMKHKYLYLSISVSGASVLAIEILGTRILGPFYGVSLFLWSALITVTLAALSAGYALGGRWADKGATYPRLSSLLAGAGLWLLAVPWIRNPILHLAEPFGLRFAALAAALVLFFVPLMLLGMVSPYAIKLRASSLEDIGRSAGNLYAISTVASVVAALLTGFFLIPSFGVYRLTLAVGILLVAAALPGFFGKRMPAAKLILPIVILAAGAGLIRGSRENAPDPERGLIFKGQSPYGEIRVVNDFEFRYLLIDGAVHTAVDTTLHYYSVMPYVHVIDLARGYFERPGRLLLIGLGGGSIAKRYHRDGWDIDAVEIDPLVTKVAYDYFGFDSLEARVHQDGRTPVSALERRRLRHHRSRRLRIELPSPFISPRGRPSRSWRRGSRPTASSCSTCSRSAGTARSSVPSPRRSGRSSRTCGLSPRWNLPTSSATSFFSRRRDPSSSATNRPSP